MFKFITKSLFIFIVAAWISSCAEEGSNSMAEELCNCQKTLQEAKKTGDEASKKKAMADFNKCYEDVSLKYKDKLSDSTFQAEVQAKYEECIKELQQSAK